MTPEHARLDSPAMEDLKQLFSDLIRFETELWNAIDARLRTEHDLPLHKFEPMQIIATRLPYRRPGCDAIAGPVGFMSDHIGALPASARSRERPAAGLAQPGAPR
jgi:MarR family transcriptional regulator, organic hydroperoxide resistance regulator